MTAPNERADVANTLENHLKRIRILEAQVASGCDCPGGHCLPSIWTSDCDTGEVTGTSTDPQAAQEVLTLYETAVFPNNNNVDIRGLVVNFQMGGGPPEDCNPIGADIYISSGISNAAGFLGSGPIGYKADIFGGADALVQGAELSATATCSVAIGVRGIGVFDYVGDGCGGSSWGVVGYSTSVTFTAAGGSGILTGVSGTGVSFGQSYTSGGVFCAAYDPAGTENDIDRVGVMASPTLDLVYDEVGEPGNPSGAIGDYYASTTNAAARTARLYAYDNAGTLEFRANLNGTVTTLCTE